MTSTRFSIAMHGMRAGLSDLAMNLHLIKGHTEYQRFIILGRPRTGSNLLLFPLRSHNNITLYGELFRQRHALIRGYPLYRMQSSKLMQLRDSNPQEFAEKFIFRSYPCRMAAVGFKIFYDHAREKHLKPIWQYLSNNKEIKVIHLQRKNKLSVLTSMRMAALQREYVSLDDRSKGRKVKIKLGYDECLRSFELFEQEERSGTASFAGHDLITVNYEALTSKFSSEIIRVQRFLGVPLQPLGILTKRQEKRSLAEVIVNFGELEKKFAGTKYSSFFENQSGS